MTRVIVRHRFAASAERVYDAWLDPAKVRQFLFATAHGEITRGEIEPTVGGRYTIVDRREGVEVVHEGSYLELVRPRRIVFTLRVPAYSTEEDRITVDIVPLAEGCELTLVTETKTEREEATRPGWETIVDALGRALTAQEKQYGVS